MIQLYVGTMCEPLNIIDATDAYSNEVMGAEVMKAVYALLEKNDFRTDNYFRWVGPTEKGSFHIDFGSWSTFIGVYPM